MEEGGTRLRSVRLMVERGSCRRMVDLSGGGEGDGKVDGSYIDDMFNAAKDMCGVDKLKAQLK